MRIRQHSSSLYNWGLPGRAKLTACEQGHVRYRDPSRCDGDADPGRHTLVQQYYIGYWARPEGPRSRQDFCYIDKRVESYDNNTCRRTNMQSLLLFTESVGCWHHLLVIRNLYFGSIHDFMKRSLFSDLDLCFCRHVSSDDIALRLGPNMLLSRKGISEPARRACILEQIVHVKVTTTTTTTRTTFFELIWRAVVVFYISAIDVISHWK